MTSQKHKATSHHPMSRREVLRMGVQSIAQQRELIELQEQSETISTCRRGRQAVERKADVMKVRDSCEAEYRN